MFTARVTITEALNVGDAEGDVRFLVTCEIPDADARDYRTTFAVANDFDSAFSKGREMLET